MRHVTLCFFRISDFLGGSSVARLGEGEAETTFKVFLRGDSIPELNEHFVVRLVEPRSEAGLEQGVALATPRRLVAPLAGTALAHGAFSPVGPSGPGLATRTLN